MKRPARLIISGLGSGYMPFAPGTWGSLVVAASMLLVAIGSGGRWYCVSGTMAVIAVLSTLGCGLLGKQAEKHFGRKDPGHITLDEFAGQAVAYIGLPMGPALGDWAIAAGVGFVAFRVFDIVKPPPARQLEKLPHGWGVVADDLMAGAYANIAAQLILRLALGFTQ